MAIYKIEGAFKHYDWGGEKYISNLIENSPKGIVAEYWLGAHPRGVAVLDTGMTKTALADHLAKRTEKLSYLFKVLDVQEMLSIQSHPNKKQALEGFAREDRLGIALDAYERNFKDKNEKAEALYALSEFYLLHGIRRVSEIQAHFEQYIALSCLREFTHDPKKLLRIILSLPQKKTNSIVEQLREELSNRSWTMHVHEYWIERAIKRFYQQGNHSEGVLTIFLLNLVHLQPGQVLYQEPNLIHAYLRGQCVEVMSNSDNVFRAGLTSKLIDVPVLLEHSSFNEKFVEFVEDQNGRYKFPSEAFCFELVRENDKVKKSIGSEIYMAISGAIEVSSEKKVIKLKTGQALYIDPNTKYSRTVLEEGLIFRVGSML